MLVLVCLIESSAEKFCFCSEAGGWSPQVFCIFTVYSQHHAVLGRSSSVSQCGTNSKQKLKCLIDHLDGCLVEKNKHSVFVSVFIFVPFSWHKDNAVS